ncbi:hypothetical protein [Lacunimicrobium album]
MAKRTQIVCLCEGEKGSSIDEVFINKLLKCLDPAWIRPWVTSKIRLVNCGNRKSVIEKMPTELRSCINAGGDTTLMVWADIDDDRSDAETLKKDFWEEAERNGISKDDFNRVVFIFAKDRLENWIEFLNNGTTDESKEGPRLKHNREVADAAKSLAEFCKNGQKIPNIPPSLEWSCRNWRNLVQKFKS